MIKKISFIFATATLAILGLLSIPIPARAQNTTAPVVYTSGTQNVILNGTANQLTTLLTFPSSTSSGTFVLSSARIIITSGSAVTAAPSFVLITGTAPATGTLNINVQVSNNDPMVIGSSTYTYVSALTGGTTSGNHILIGGTAGTLPGTLAATIAALQGSGTNAQFETTGSNSSVTVSSGTGNTINLVATASGTSGNTVATTESFTAAQYNNFFSGTTLQGGYTGGAVLSGTTTLTGTTAGTVTLVSALAPTPIVVTGSLPIPIQIKQVTSGTATTLGGKVIIEGIQAQ